MITLPVLLSWLATGAQAAAAQAAPVPPPSRGPGSAPGVFSRPVRGHTR